MFGCIFFDGKCKIIVGNVCRLWNGLILVIIVFCWVLFDNGKVIFIVLVIWRLLVMFWLIISFSLICFGLVIWIRCCFGEIILLMLVFIVVIILLKGVWINCFVFSCCVWWYLFLVFSIVLFVVFSVVCVCLCFCLLVVFFFINVCRWL